MKIFQKEIPDEIIEQICKIQNELLFEKSDFDLIKSLALSGVLFFTELDNNRKIISFCLVKPSFDEWEIYDVATISKHQNHGFAKKLIAEFLSFAEKNKVKKIFLEVRGNNEKAINLYSKFGFEKYAIRKNYYANNGDNAICMMKNMVNCN
ncbi:MAG: ribosomal protein S18-alanine N-acetyltransferase [Chitinispirillales bacterium]|jgi:ribosomal-protein-alanine N-acetyltransferase|nr:ribosomal protein S18-alanine N-acetyltransferase [Chitinispirillales bacterium]